MDRLLRPRTIAVIGGGTWCANVIDALARIGFDGVIWPVHPTKSQIGGVVAHATLPGVPDAAFIGVNRHATVDVVRHLATLGAGGAVCFAAGFGESQAETGDGAALQRALVAAAGDMPLLGPNCYGMVNYLDRVALWPDQHGGVPVDRGVAILTQSSNIAINLTMQNRGLPLAFIATMGNQAQTGFSRLGMALLDDPRITALGLHIEGIDDLVTFQTLAAHARALDKPIVALRVGQSDHARAATLSHTASIAGSGAGARALLARLGIGQVDTLPALLEALKLLHAIGPLGSADIASLSCSGGEAGVMGDLAQGTGLRFPPLGPAQMAGLRSALGGHVALANPLDYQTGVWGNLPATTAAFTAMMQGDPALGIVVLDLPRTDRCDDSAWHYIFDAVAQTRADTGKPMAILALQSENMPESTVQMLATRGIPALCGGAEGLAAIAAAAQIGMARVHPPLLLPPPDETGMALDEARAKATVARHGVPVPEARHADTPGQAADKAGEIGFPVALKGTGAAHKTEAGLVALNLADSAQVLEAAARMAAPAFLVERMITGTVAELLIGVVADPAHGYVLTLAAGGTLAELWADSAALLLPVTAPDVEAALDTLRVAPLLHGYRGAPPADMPAIVAAVLAVQDCVAAHADAILELEINPLICTPTAAIAADALIRHTKGACLD